MAFRAALHDQRKVSATLYCNPRWLPEHGGAMRIWEPVQDGGATVDVEPIGGRLVLLLSGCTEHEVRPSCHDRCAITSWFW